MLEQIDCLTHGINRKFRNCLIFFFLYAETQILPTLMSLKLPKRAKNRDDIYSPSIKK